MRCNLVNDYRSLAAAMLVAGVVLAGGSFGCADSGATTEPADAALKDPMNYTPSIPNTDMRGTGTMDTKSFDKDINDLLNP
jgi:hypothetical protein